MVYVARFASHKFIPIHMPIGSRIPMFCTAAGRAYLSALSEPAARELLEASARVRYTQHTIVDFDVLLVEIGNARTQGYAFNGEELFAGDMAVSAAIIGSQGLPIAALAVITPASRWSPDDVRRQIVPQLLECTRSISNSVRAFT